ncbi:hypothetical protein SE17_34620, partial [Kouleothrix aurantiaca]
IDAITRTRLQDELAAIQRKLHKTILFVTHDVEEALRLADKIIIMRKGTIVQYDTPLGIVTRPRDAFVEQLVGTDDMLRRLSLIHVRDVLHGDGDIAAANGLPTIRADTDLRSALSHMLASNAEALGVTDASGQPIGRVTFAAMRAAVAGRAASA